VTKRRPPIPCVLLATLFAALTIRDFALGNGEAWWLDFGGLFLTLEITGAAMGNSLSEWFWVWTGVRPPRPLHWLRGLIVANFGVEVWVLHFYSGGVFWWGGGRAVIYTAIPVVGVIVWSNLERRQAMRLGDLVKGIKLLRLMSRVRDLFKRAASKKAVAFGLIGAATAGVLTAWLAQCPGLATNWRSIASAMVTAGVGSLFARAAVKPQAGTAVKVAATGIVVGSATAGMQQVTNICGTAFVEAMWTLAATGIVAGVGHYLEHPQPPMVTLEQPKPIPPPQPGPRPMPEPGPKPTK
jgi:hypothetical protein